jgi:hypothetical protein
MLIGYARVSTDGQSLEAQQAALKANGAERIFSEKVSGAVTDRKALGQAIKALGNGDVLLVTRLDRLARSTRGPSQHPGSDQQGRGQVPIPSRCLGRHINDAWRADGDDPSWLGDVRATSDPS